MNSPRKSQLTAEAAERRETLEQLKLMRDRAVTQYKRTRADADGRAVSDVEQRLRLAEIALDGVLDDLKEADESPRVHITDSRAGLVAQRRDLETRLGAQRKDHEQALEIVRQRCGYRNPEWVKRHVENTYQGDPEQSFLRRTRELRTHLDNVVAQLAELDRREGLAPSPEAA